jgi:hypothetical protein
MEDEREIAFYARRRAHVAAHQRTRAEVLELGHAITRGQHAKQKRRFRNGRFSDGKARMNSLRDEQRAHAILREYRGERCAHHAAAQDRYVVFFTGHGGRV